MFKKLDEFMNGYQKNESQLDSFSQLEYIKKSIESYEMLLQEIEKNDENLHRTQLDDCSFDYRKNRLKMTLKLSYFYRSDNGNDMETKFVDIDSAMNKLKLDGSIKNYTTNKVNPNSNSFDLELYFKM